MWERGLKDFYELVEPKRFCPHKMLLELSVYNKPFIEQTLRVRRTINLFKIFLIYRNIHILLGFSVWYKLTMNKHYEKEYEERLTCLKCIDKSKYKQKRRTRLFHDAVFIWVRRC